MDSSTNSLSFDLHTYRWPSQNIENQQLRGVILIFMGFGSHIQRYSLVAKIFNESGYDVVGFDYKNFGKSAQDPKFKGFIEDIEKFYNEGYQFLQVVRDYYNHRDDLTQNQKDTLTYIAFGFSLGGQLAVGVQQLSVKNSTPGFDALILNAPNFTMKFREPLEIVQKQLLDFMNGDISTPMSKDYNQFSEFGDKGMFKFYQDDDLVIRSATYCQTLLLNSEPSQQYKDGFKFINVPVYLALARNDSVVDNEESRKFMQSIITGESFKQCKEYDCEHPLLYNENVYEQLVNDEIQWLESIINF
eukprot:403361337